MRIKQDKEGKELISMMPGTMEILNKYANLL